MPLANSSGPSGDHHVARDPARDVLERAGVDARPRNRCGPRRGGGGECVAAVACAWLARYVATARNAKGRALAATRVARHLAPLLGQRPLRALTGDDVRAYRLALESRGLSPQTVVHLLSDLRAMLLWAVSERRLDRSPFPRRVLPRVPERAPRGLAPEEVATLQELEGPWGFVLRLLIGTGLRWSEACRARAEHVRGDWLEVAQTKSGRLRRVPLSRALLAEVRRRSGRLVPFSAGSPGSFARVVRRRSGLADFHPHRCRHTFAMRWLAAGGSLPVLQELLGHRDLSTTMRYARVSDELVRREAARVARRLRTGRRRVSARADRSARAAGRTPGRAAGRTRS